MLLIPPTHSIGDCKGDFSDHDDKSHTTVEEIKHWRIGEGGERESP